MKSVIDPQFRKQFLSLSPEIVILKWLESISTKNKEYRALIERKILTPKESKQFNIPICIPEGLGSLTFPHTSIF